MKDLAIVTFLWDDENYKDRGKITFGAGHVNKLGRALRRNCTLDFDFVLVTDAPESQYEQFTEADRIVPLWSDWRSLGGCYVRLKAFQEETGKLLANKRFMWLDLDIVITGNIDHLVDHDHDFWSWLDVNPPTPYCGSVMGMKVGARPQVWDDFKGSSSKAQTKHYIGTDQAWIGHCLGIQEKTFGREHGIYSYQKHIYSREQTEKMQRKANQPCDPALPEDACMVVFHGDVDPSICGGSWVKEHWF